MQGFYSECESRVRIESVSLSGPGVLILTGPSSCGKGEVAAALCKLMSIPPEHHLSMGEILRTTVKKAKTDPDYALLLSTKYRIDNTNNIFDCLDSSEELSSKVLSYTEDLKAYFKREGMEKFTSQLEWLEFCTYNGLLVPNRWTQEFVSANIEYSPYYKTRPFIIDGYPRKIGAAEHLLSFLRSLNIPVIKALHLSISKQEMIARARLRGRADDDEQSLLARYQFYVESVHPTVDYLKQELGSTSIVLIDAHQPIYDIIDGQKKLNLQASINNVVASALRGLGIPEFVVRDLIRKRIS